MRDRFTRIIRLYIYFRRWQEVLFLRYMYFGKLPKNKEEENKPEMHYDAFLCYMFISFSGNVHKNLERKNLVLCNAQYI